MKTNSKNDVGNMRRTIKEIFCINKILCNNNNNIKYLLTDVLCLLINI